MLMGEVAELKAAKSHMEASMRVQAEELTRCKAEAVLATSARQDLESKQKAEASKLQQNLAELQHKQQDMVLKVQVGLTQGAEMIV